MEESRLFGRLLDLLYPRRCPFCLGFLKEDEHLFCRRCAATLPFVERGPIYNVEGVESCVAPLWFQDSVRKAIHRFKFKRATSCAPVFASLMAGWVREYQEGEYDLITWVPLSRKKRGRRGYDQAALLAEVLAKELNCPCTCLLRKKGDIQVQSSLKSAAARRANVLGMYEVLDRSLCAGKRILLVDDVVTTGSTLSECAVMLLIGGAKCVYAVTAARAGEAAKG